MTTDELIALLRANPAAAIGAIKAARIAGPRVKVGLTDSYRQTAGGWRELATVHVASRGGWYTIPPSPRGLGYAGGQVNSTKGETLEAFTARADELWRAAGWILVDEADKS